MSSSDPLETLRVEASCSVCLGYLRDPVLLECGHNFCRSCITRWWAELSRDFPCPVCRKTSRRRALRPNRQLANMIHGRALVRFCQNPSRVAKCANFFFFSSFFLYFFPFFRHVPVENHLRIQEIPQNLQRAELRFLQEEEEVRITKIVGKKNTILVQTATMLHRNHQELDIRWGKPHDAELWDLISFFFSPFFALIQRRNWSGFWGAVDPLCSRFFPTPPLFPFPVDVTLDPTTAGPEVILSEDLKEATWGRPGRRWPQGPGRFDTDPCMLGSQGFTSGRHYWEVEASGRFWTVGVARESVRREGRILFKPNAEIWGLQKYDELCVALTAPSNTFVPLRSGEIGVYLDYEVGQVSFYALGTRCCVFTFRVASFSGERVFPYFCVLLSTIKLPPRA
uniref:Uncharacterized protein n=2 Tax=Anas TaxID=8835 RepID=A0A8B9ZVX8_9AVES